MCIHLIHTIPNIHFYLHLTMLFAELAIFSILIGSVAIGSMVFTEEKDSTFKNEPTKHQNFEPNSKYDIDKTNYNSYQDFTGDDNISIDSKRHHPRALEDVASYKYEI